MHPTRRIPLLFFALAPVLLYAQPLSWENTGHPDGGGYRLFEDQQGYLYTVRRDLSTRLRSDDGGLNWHELPAPPWGSATWPVFAGADSLLYGSTTHEMYQSADHGETWTLAATVEHRSCFALPGGILLAGDIGPLIRRSADHGQHWTTVSTGADALGGFGRNPYNGDVFAWNSEPGPGETGRLWRSADQGQTWSALLEKTGLFPNSITFLPGGGIFVGTLDVVWHSLNNGVTWNAIEPTVPNLYAPVQVAADAGARLFVFESGLSAYSDDAGTTWLPLEDAAGNAYLDFVPTVSGRLFARRYGGSLHRSDDNGATWTISAAGIGEPELRDLRLLSSTQRLALTTDGLYFTANDGADWTLIWDQVNFQQNPVRPDVDAAPGGVWYLWTGGALVRFNNDGQQHTTLNPPIADPGQLLGIWVHPQNGDLYLSDPAGLYRSGDAGASWIQATTFSPDNLAFLPDGSLLSGAPGGLYKSADAGVTWTLLSPASFWPNGPLVALDGQLYGLKTLPELYVSPDEGLTWAVLPVDYPHQITTLPVVDNAGHIFLHDAFDGVILESVDGGRTFNALPYLTGSFAGSLLIDTAQRLYLRTEGGGIYRSNRPTTTVKLLQGSVFHDRDLDCLFAAPDTLLSDQLVAAVKTGSTVATYGNVDGAGRFTLPVDTGDYRVTVAHTNLYWESCETLVSIPNDTTLGVVDSVGVGLRIHTDCPLTGVYVVAPRLRRCFSNPVYVHYFNEGALPTDTARITLTLDSLLSLDTAYLPIASQSGNMYTFDLGHLDPFQQGSFTLYCMPDCATPLGYILCVEARITPGEICPPFQGPQLRATGECLGDSVRFRIDNTGAAAMSTPQPWYLVDPEDPGASFTILQTGAVQLGAGESFSLTAPSGYRELVFNALQDPGYLFNQVSRVIVQGCGFGGVPLSVIRPGRDDHFAERYCLRVQGAYDPNDKTGFPEGLGDKHYIERGEPVEYLIRFQNTGTDTAFNVSVRDTLSDWLDPASARLGVSSHPCRLQVAPNGALLFAFEQILLPDSNANEAASHGFVYFSVLPRAGLPKGAAIRNRAAIYFDFNDPVLTNETLHTVGVPGVSAVPPGPPVPPAASVAPNPMRSAAVLRIAARRPAPGGRCTLELFDTAGRCRLRQVFSGAQTTVLRGDLPAGLYFFTVKTENGALLSSGKIAVE